MVFTIAKNASPRYLAAKSKPLEILTHKLVHIRIILLLALLLAGCAGFFQANATGPHKAAGTRDRLYRTDTTPPIQAKFSCDTFSLCLPGAEFQFDDISITNGHTIISRQWDISNGITDTSSEVFLDFETAGNYTITMTITDDSGHTSTASMLLTLAWTGPAVNLGPDTSICQGSTITLDAGPQAAGAQYYWNTGETTRSIQVSTDDLYYVQVTDGGCPGYDEVRVSTRPELAVDFSSSQVDSCLPVTVHFTDLTQVCSTNIVYRRWDFDNGDTSALQNPAYLYAAGGNHTVTLTEKDDNGLVLTKTQTIFVDTRAIPVNLGNDTIICYGTPITLDAGSLASHYTWNTGDTTRTISVKEAGLYTVHVSRNNCLGWNSIQVQTIFPLAPAFSSDITSKCLPVTVHFADNTQIVCGAAPLTRWAWDFGDGDTAQQQNPTHVYHTAGPFTVKMAVYDSLGIADTISKNITITTIGPDRVIMPDATICLGHSVDLDAGNEDARYAWTPAAPLSGDTIRNPQATPGVTTLFRVQVSKCGVTITDSVTIYVDSVSRPVLQYDGSQLTAQPAASYQWYKNDEVIPGATDRSYKPLSAGYYGVEISNTKGCFGRSAGYFFLPEGVSVPGSRIKVKVSPNPATGDFINVLFSIIPAQPVNINVYDVFGRMVYSGSCSSVVNPIDCSHFYKGMYYVEVMIKGQKVTLPFIRE